MDERENKIFEMVKLNRRREIIRKFLKNSKLVWILDPYPYETHIITYILIKRSFKKENWLILSTTPNQFLRIMIINR